MKSTCISMLLAAGLSLGLTGTAAAGMIDSSAFDVDPASTSIDTTGAGVVD